MDQGLGFILHLDSINRSSASQWLLVQYVRIELDKQQGRDWASEQKAHAVGHGQLAVEVDRVVQRVAGEGR
jgi:hypothetical protein